MRDQKKTPRKDKTPPENNGEGLGKIFNDLTQGLSTSVKQIFNPRTEQGRFFQAVKSNQLEEVRTMVENGIDVNICDLKGDRPLHIAAAHNLADMVKLLLSLGAQASLTQEIKDGETPLRLAILTGNEAAALALVEHGAYAPDPDETGWTLLHHAVHKNCTGLVKAILHKGVDANERTVKGSTALIIAVKTGLEEMTLALLDIPDIARGINTFVNHNDPLGQNAFHLALQNRSEKVVRKMIEKGAHTNLCDKTGRSPLHCAIAAGKQAYVKILLDHGADLAKNRQACLVNFACDTQHDMTDESRAEIIALLLDKGADPDKPDVQSGKTPLITAIETMEPLTFKALLRHGANPSSCASDGTPPLFYALQTVPDQMIPSLVKMGASIDQRHSADGRTALIEAVKKENVSLVDMLLDKKADATLADINGKTALSYARATGNKVIIGMIEKSLTSFRAPVKRTGLS